MRKKSWLGVGAVAVLLLTGGCADSSYPYYRAANLNGELSVADPVTCDSSQVQGANAYVQLMCEVRKAYNNAGVDDCLWRNTLVKDEPKCTVLRARILGDLMGISNVLCEEHLSGIMGRDASFNIVTGTATNAFSGLATVVTPAATKSIFSGLAAFASGTKSLVNETIYQSLIASAVTRKIVDKRELNKNSLRTVLKKPIKDFPISMAIEEAIAHHNLCSFQNGLIYALKEGTDGNEGNQLAKIQNAMTQLMDKMNGLPAAANRTPAQNIEFNTSETLYNKLAEEKMNLLIPKSVVQ